MKTRGWLIEELEIEHLQNIIGEACLIKIKLVYSIYTETFFEKFIRKISEFLNLKS